MYEILQLFAKYYMHSGQHFIGKCERGKTEQLLKCGQ